MVEKYMNNSQLQLEIIFCLKNFYLSGRNGTSTEHKRKTKDFWECTSHKKRDKKTYI